MEMEFQKKEPFSLMDQSNEFEKPVCVLFPIGRRSFYEVKNSRKSNDRQIDSHNENTLLKSIYDSE